jgi:hypothetical protein
MYLSFSSFQRTPYHWIKQFLHMDFLTWRKRNFGYYGRYYGTVYTVPRQGNQLYEGIFCSSPFVFLLNGTFGLRAFGRRHGHKWCFLCTVILAVHLCLCGRWEKASSMGLLFGESLSLDISCGDSPARDEDCTLLSMAGRVSSKGSVVSAPEGPEIDERNRVAKLMSEIELRH